jgi:hypothetical protein
MNSAASTPVVVAVMVPVRPVAVSVLVSVIVSVPAPPSMVTLVLLANSIDSVVGVSTRS